MILTLNILEIGRGFHGSAASTNSQSCVNHQHELMESEGFEHPERRQLLAIPERDQITTHENDRQGRIFALNLFGQSYTVDTRHVYIRDHEHELMLRRTGYPGNLCQSLLAVHGRYNLMFAQGFP